MKITAIDTVQVAEFPSLVFVRVHTDDGLIGLGETFFHADPVVAHIHGGIAPYLLGKDPHHRRASLERASHLRRQCAPAEPRCAPPRRSTSRFGTCAARPPASRCTSCWAERRGTRSGSYNTCAGYRYVRAGYDQSVDNWGLPDGTSEGPYEDLEAFLHHADDLARDLLLRGHLGHEDLAVRSLRRGQRRTRDIGCRTRPGARADPKDPLGRGLQMDVMIELHGLWDVPAACRIAHALEPFDPYWIEDPVRVANAAALAEVQAHHARPAGRGRDARGPGRVSRHARARAARALRSSTRLGRRDRHGPQGCRPCRGATSARSLPTTAPARSSTPPATHLSMHAPNAIVQEHVRAFATGWYPSS